MSLSVCLVLHSEVASEMLVVCSKQKHGVMSARLADVKVFQHKHAGLPAVVTPSVKGAAESNLYSNIAHHYTVNQPNFTKQLCYLAFVSLFRPQ